jgi:hypothetical protein
LAITPPAIYIYPRKLRHHQLSKLGQLQGPEFFNFRFSCFLQRKSDVFEQGH